MIHLKNVEPRRITDGPSASKCTSSLAGLPQVFHIRGIATAASGVESTSLALAFGLDLFFSPVQPAGGSAAGELLPGDRGSVRGHGNHWI